MTRQNTKDSRPQLTKEQEQKLDVLAHDYFWKQKAWEIGLVILAIIFVAVLMPLIGYYTLQFFPDLKCGDMGLFMSSHQTVQEILENGRHNDICEFTGNYGQYFLAGFIGTLTIVLILGFIGCILMVFIHVFNYWVESNWTEAQRRARKDLNLPPAERKTSVYDGGVVYA